MPKKQLPVLCAVFFISVLLATSAWAIPALQIYIPGADYIDETWVITSYDYDLYVVGAPKKEDGYVYDVKIALAVPLGEEGSITITWETPNLPDYGSTDVDGDYQLTLSESDGMDYDAYRESYMNQDPDPSTYGWAENSTPLMGDGSPLPSHGVFPTDFYEYFVGDLGRNETIYNYIPGDEWMDEAPGQTKIFHVSVQGYTWVDIVAYDHVILSENKARYVFSPFSHDGASTVPEPATMLLLGTGMIGLALGRYRRQRR